VREMRGVRPDKKLERAWQKFVEDLQIPWLWWYAINVSYA